MITDTRLLDCHFSELKRMALSPAHCRAAMLEPREVNPKASYLRHGLGVDAILFGVQPYVVWEGERRAGKVWDEFSAKFSDFLILSREEFNRADASAQAIAHNRDAMRVLDGDRQRSIAWEWLGRKCHSTLDIIKPGSHITELKTARSAHPDRFRFAAIRYCYHAQHRFYGLAAEYAGMGAHEHFIVVAESAPPWAVTVLRVTPRTLLAGERMLRVWMERLLACEASGDFPAYTQTILDLDLDDESELIFDDDPPGEEAA